MAERRMFSKLVTDSDSFLDMPASAQALYFHLALHADDDGFLDCARRIQREVSASADDLKLLIAKRFIIPFETGVIVIRHWRIHNYVRGDRYKPTIHADERQQVRSEKNGIYELETDGTPLVYQADTIGVPTVDAGKDNLAKARVVEDNTLSSPSAPDGVDYQAIIELFNSLCPSLPKVRRLTDTRRRAIKARLAEVGEDGLRELFSSVESSDFLSGRASGWHGCAFDWILKPANFTKILEGNYQNHADSGNKNGGRDDLRTAHSASAWDGFIGDDGVV